MKRALLALGFVAVAGAALAEPCPGNPDALGVSRVMTVGAREYSRLGVMQYQETLPLADREVVLTFDDGPLPPYTDNVLSMLAAECVKATFFLVGRHAKAHPEAARRVYNAGHTIGTHSQNHPLTFHVMSGTRAEHEIDEGIASVAAALGEPKALAPFFRIPGLLRTQSVEAHLRMRSLVVWSADTNADDWRKIGSDRVLQLALSRLEERGKGMLLLHDIQPRTVLMLPTLLRELKSRGFKIVHVVPEGERPKLPEVPEVAVAAASPMLNWPRTVAKPVVHRRTAESAPRAAAGLLSSSAARDVHRVY